MKKPPVFIGMGVVFSTGHWINICAGLFFNLNGHWTVQLFVRILGFGRWILICFTIDIGSTKLVIFLKEIIKYSMSFEHLMNFFSQK